MKKTEKQDSEGCNDELRKKRLGWWIQQFKEGNKARTNK